MPSTVDQYFVLFVNPLNPIPALGASVGSDIIADRATFEAMSYQGSDVARDAYLAGQEFVKFWIVGTNTDHPAVYFMNTNTYVTMSEPLPVTTLRTEIEGGADAFFESGAVVAAVGCGRLGRLGWLGWRRS